MAELALDRKEKAALAELKSKLEALLGTRLKRLILFGSKARGNFGPDSDLDVAILVDELTRELKSQIFDLVIDVEFLFELSITSLVFSLDEFEHLKSRERRIALDIESEGIPL
jgi:predicted nucleotidyltransferase